MSVTSAPVRLAVAGWLLATVFGALVVFVSDDAFGVVILAVSLLMAAWLAFRPSVAALGVSLALGALLAVQEVSYLVAGLTRTPLETGTVLSDVEGVAAALLVCLASVAGLLRRSRVSAAEARSATP